MNTRSLCEGFGGFVWGLELYMQSRSPKLQFHTAKHRGEAIEESVVGTCKMPEFKAASLSLPK